MDLKNGRQIWEKIFSIFSNEIDETWKNFFFQNVEYNDYIDNTLYLICPNDFIRNSIVKKNQKRIEDIIKNKLNMNTKIDFILNSNEIKHLASFTKKESETLSFQEEYNFDNFVQGPSNRLAYAAALSVGQAPAMESDLAYNPLFIYGGVGLGKTHLMHAIANKIHEKNSNYKIEYVSSETFTNHLIESIRENKNEEFRAKYRSLDVILIDDIQFLSGKEGTQEEFFHTFNALQSLNKQIVISSDRPPKEISTLEDRLRSRFEQGLIVDIQPPDFETRVAILKNKAINLKKLYSKKSDSIIPINLDIPEEAYKFIAKNIKSNIRELEGALIKVYAYATLINIDITYDMILKCLSGIIKEDENKEITPDVIKNIVAEEYLVKVSEINGKRRTQKIADARQVAMYLCREMTDLSLPKLGDEFDRDHTTVLHAYNKIQNEISEDNNLKIKIDKIVGKIKNN